MDKFEPWSNAIRTQSQAHTDNYFNVTLFYDYSDAALFAWLNDKKNLYTHLTTQQEWW